MVRSFYSGHDRSSTNRRAVHALPVAGSGNRAYHDGCASPIVLKGARTYVRIAVIGVSNVLEAKASRGARDVTPGRVTAS